MTNCELIVYGVIVHLICDWLLQNDWMAKNKTNIRHVAGYVHGLIHTIGMLFIMPITLALVIGVSHWVIDFRFIPTWWGKIYRQTSEGIFALTVAVWRDQVIHIMIIVFIVEITGV